MSVNILDLEQAAISLFPNAEGISNEAIQRAFTNRQYYITYHRLLQLIEKHFTQYDMSDEGTFGNTGSHKRVYFVLDDIYRNTNSKEAQKLSLKFTNFLSKRHKADYHLEKNFDEFDYKQILKFASEIPQLADTLIVLQGQQSIKNLTRVAL